MRRSAFPDLVFVGIAPVFTRVGRPWSAPPHDAAGVPGSRRRAHRRDPDRPGVGHRERAAALDGAGWVALAVAVDDPDVAEAFVRVAYYARGDARSRQLATRDSPFVQVGEDRRIVVELDRPPGAVAYRLRVLGRLVAGGMLSRADAIRVRSDVGAADRGRPRPALRRLETDLP